MKKVIVTSFLVAGILNMSSLQAQMSNPKITLEEQGKFLNDLFRKDDDASKASLLKEALLMSKSKNEDFVIMSGRVYAGLDDTGKSEEVNRLVLKKFPKGKKARGDAYQAFAMKEGSSAGEKETAYNQWIKNFPAQGFLDKDRGIYSLAAGDVAVAYAKEGNVDKVRSYMAGIRNEMNYVSSAINVTRELLKKDQNAYALEVIGEAYKTAEESANKSEKSDKDNSNMRYKNLASSLYGEALLANGQLDAAASHLSALYAVAPSGPTLIKLAEAYEKQGKNLDAFLLLQDYVVKNGKTEELEKAMGGLYSKLNNQKGSFENYLVGIDAQIKQALVSKYKAEMVNTVAPNFALQDMNGKTVSLADLKGKVVVLDFWATWCGPCKISFPGMQAAVNKYANDPDVVFLFVNTWQSEANYQDLVREFVSTNNYSFQVLFDEMKDKAKATVTAYGVKGIPTKVIIDKEGMIRFQSSGGSADVAKIVLEMETKIELARSEKG